MKKDFEVQEFRLFLSKYTLVDLIAEAIERMLQTERRRDLQVVLVSEGIFDTFV